ncbi:hypothetical protein PVK06_015425 [Gossypium arboreum]|uniref:BZIP domain-containing protein n=1 Tax=Gossypium arboreum TaxID=29729 RepID=A0ABR0PXA8_GOSAR|nr:hypothetical protein PVK06_015425 [Gossypium arboreum]
MEEVWKDISLASLSDHPVDSILSTRTKNPNFPSMILLDFLATPINKEPPTPRTSGVSSNDTSSTEGPAPFVPGTILSLKFGFGSACRCTESADPIRPNLEVNARAGVPAALSFSFSHNSGFRGFGSPKAFPSFCTKRAPKSSENSSDRRRKRMMKNRESAARSRARKQLELEVAHLQEENAKLRRQQEKILATRDQVPKKNTLSRTSTAPF